MFTHIDVHTNYFKQYKNVQTIQKSSMCLLLISVIRFTDKFLGFYSFDSLAF